VTVLPVGNAMNDIVAQLRYAADDTDAVKNASIAYLLEHAAGEIELLRGYRDAAESDAAISHLLVDRLRLTDAEREAISEACESVKLVGTEKCYATLRGLLARCAIGHQDGSGQ